MRIGLLHTRSIDYRSLITLQIEHEVKVNIGWQGSRIVPVVCSCNLYMTSVTYMYMYMISHTIRVKIELRYEIDLLFEICKNACICPIK